jgi:hypothetical protein
MRVDPLGASSDLVGFEAVILNTLETQIASGDFGRAFIAYTTSHTVPSSLTTPYAYFAYGGISGTTVHSETVSREPTFAPNYVFVTDRTFSDLSKSESDGLIAGVAMFGFLVMVGICYLVSKGDGHSHDHAQKGEHAPVAH